MAVGDDGALVAAIAGDGSVALSRAGAPLHRLAVQLEPRGVALAPDARSILIWSEADAQVWDVAAETRTAVLRVGGTRISAIGFGPRADRVVIATAEGTVRVFDTATGLLRAALPGVEGPRWFQIAASGAAVAFGGDGGVEEWDAGDDAIVRVLEVGDTAESVAFSADGRRVAACGRDGIVHVWSVTDGIERARIAQSASPCVAALGPDGAFVATGDATGLIQTWDVETGARRAIINAAGPAVNAIAIDALGERLATVPASAPAAPAVAIVWDARSGARVHELAGARGSVYSVAWSRDGARVATCGRDGAALIWRVTDGARLDALAHDLPCPGIAFDPAGQRVITASGKDAFIWRLDTRTRVPLAGHEQLVTTAGFATPELVVTTSYDGSARVWTAASGRQVDRFLHPGPVEEADITRDGSMMATRSDDRIYVWSLAATR
jgi:WD40 repeat protein